MSLVKDTDLNKFVRCCGSNYLIKFALKKGVNPLV